MYDRNMVKIISILELYIILGKKLLW